MKITKYPQSCFLIEHKNKIILIDPGSYCYNANFTAENWPKVDILLLTHEHSDHFQPEAIKIILKKSQPIIITNQSCYDILKENNIDSVIINPSEEIKIGEVRIKGIKAQHGPLPNGQPAPEVIAFMIDDIFYHTGDTIYLEEKPYAKIVAVSMCGTIAMTPAEAAKFINEIKPELAIPIHYHNPMFLTDPNLFVEAMRDSAIPVKILGDGESVEV